MAAHPGDTGEAGMSDRFEPIRLLGRGGMGEVWQVRDSLTGEEVSLKRVSAAQAKTPIGQRLRREYLNLQQLRHPAILEVKNYAENPVTGEAWFSSEVLRGPSSTDLSGTLNFHRWLQLSAGFLRSLAFLHRNGWVHGDIKPDNIRLRSPVGSQPMDPVLLDFGLTRREHLPAEEKILGTPQSMAPEQWLGQPPDFRSDVYSAGILLFHWWTGRFPFEDVSKPLLSSAHLHDEIVDPGSLRSGLPVEVSGILLKMLAKRPDDRPSNAGEVLSTLATTLDEEVNEKAETVASLLSQIEYAGVGEAPVRELQDALLQWVGSSAEQESLIHLHRNDADRKIIVDRVVGILQSRGIGVVTLKGCSTEPFFELSRSIDRTWKKIVVLVRDPELGNSEWQKLLQIRQWKSSRLHWWISSRETPAGFFGQALSVCHLRKISTDASVLPELDEFVENALPGCQLSSRVRGRLQSWGQDQPGMWRRILRGRIKSGELNHDGQRWIWRENQLPVEDCWRKRAQQEASTLSDSSGRILAALAVLGKPGSVAEISTLVELPSGELPVRIAELAAQKWLRVGRRIQFVEPFQQDAILAALDAGERKEIHARVIQLSHEDRLEKAHHQLSAGNAIGAAETLRPSLREVEQPKSLEEALRWVPLLSSLVQLLPQDSRGVWLEMLGQMEDRLGHSALRDHAWREAERCYQSGSREALRLTRWRASVYRRDGESRKALACIEGIARQEIDFSNSQVMEEAILVALEFSRIQRGLARQGLGKLPKKDPLAEWIPRCRGAMRVSLILEQCRRYLLQGSRLRARDHARIALGESSIARVNCEAMSLLARANGDLPSLRLWSKLHGFLARKENRHEAATAAEVDAVEALQRMGESPRIGTEIHSLIERARKECPAQLPRALLVRAREESGRGFIRSAARDLEEAMSLEGPAGIVAWEGNLLVAASEWVAGRTATAIKILEAAKPDWAPHEPERIDVHARHAILRSRCVRSLGELSGSLFVIDHALADLRMRGTEQDLVSLRWERIALLRLLGRDSLARMEESKLKGLTSLEPGLDPEPAGSRRAEVTFRDLVRGFGRSIDEEDWNSRLEGVALDALRLRAQPLSLRIQLAKLLSTPHPDSESLARHCWKKAVRLETREARALVLGFWARVRREQGDLKSAQILQLAAERELDRWYQRSPSGSVQAAIAEWLGIEEGSLRISSAMGGRNNLLT